MTKKSAIYYFKSNCVLEFKNSFLNYSKNWLNVDDILKFPNELREVFIDYFSSKEFLNIYKDFAYEICKEFNILDKEILFQQKPTPRVFLHKAHGTNWHTDYWYGHGLDCKTVWVPIQNAVVGSTFDVVKYEEDNERLLKFYSQNPDLLAKEFNLNGIETEKVNPKDNTAVIFDSTTLHGSTNNINNLTRLSFDFRYTSISDKTSTKNLDYYFKYLNKKFHKNIKFPIERLKMLKYICGGLGYDTSSQHILIEMVCKDMEFQILGQEAEIERFNYPMIKMHIDEIKRKKSKYSAVVAATKDVFNDDILNLLSANKIPTFFALERKWLN